jgi:hypothetical protein
MYFTDDSLLLENQEKLIIKAAPRGPQWLPGDFSEDIDVSWDGQVQKAVDCYNAFVELDPVWTDQFMATGTTIYAGGLMTPKLVELLSIAFDASYTHMYAPGTRRHIKAALEVGATMEDRGGAQAVRGSRRSGMQSWCTDPRGGNRGTLDQESVMKIETTRLRQ